MNDFQLTKTSCNEEIKNYFLSVLKVSKSGKEFPINLDEVWMLVYPRKDHAVRELKNTFIENVDYQVFPKIGEQDADYVVFAQNGKNPNGGRPTNEYLLTVPCMEYFIARKVRPVFEVYRQVFHHTMQTAIEQNQPQPKQLALKDKISWVKEVKKLLNLNDNSTLSLLQQVGEPLGLPLPDYTPSKGILKSATELLKEIGSTLTVYEFNTLMLKYGFLADMTRKSTKGTVKHFKSLTDKAKKYGENQVSPKAPNQTQPMYYADTFSQLLDSISRKEAIAV